MQSCWMSPDGEVVYIDENDRWRHTAVAGNILKERYKYELNINDHKLEWLDILHSKGWIRYSPPPIGWVYNQYTLTDDQQNKVFDLTGELLERWEMM